MKKFLYIIFLVLITKVLLPYQTETFDRCKICERPKEWVAKQLTFKKVVLDHDTGIHCEKAFEELLRNKKIATKHFKNIFFWEKYKTSDYQNLEILLLVTLQLIRLGEIEFLTKYAQKEIHQLIKRKNVNAILFRGKVLDNNNNKI